MQTKTLKVNIPVPTWHKDEDEVEFFGIKKKVYAVRADCVCTTGASIAIMLYAAYMLQDTLMKSKLYKHETKRDLNQLMKEVHLYENSLNARYDDGAVEFLLDFQMNVRTNIKRKIEKFYNELRIPMKKEGYANTEVRAWTEVAITASNAAHDILAMYRKEMAEKRIRVGRIGTFLDTERIRLQIYKLHARLGVAFAPERGQKAWDVLFKAASSGQILLKSIKKAAEDNNL